jgi:hypothetical protein
VQESLAYLVTHDPAERDACLAELAELRRLFEDFAEVAKIETPGEERERGLWRRILELHTAIEADAASLFEAASRGESVDAAMLRRYEQTVESIFAVIDEFAALERQEVESVQSLMVSTIREAQISLWAVAVTVLGLATVVGLVLRRFVSDRSPRPRSALSAAALRYKRRLILANGTST